jgi:formylglycine-generating enzyme required for sulfatase activity
MSCNFTAIRQLVAAAFSDDDLRVFCFDHFPAVYQDFAAGQTQGQRVLLLVDFATRHGQLDLLLAAIEKANPYQYSKFQAEVPAGLEPDAGADGFSAARPATAPDCSYAPAMAKQEARPAGAQIDVNQQVGGGVSGEVTGVKMGTVQGDVNFLGPVTVTLPGMAAELASRLVPGAASSAEDLRHPVISRKPFEPDTVYVPTGPFLMGNAQGSGAPVWEMPEQTVTLPDYRIGKYPVTNAQYLAFARDKRIAVSPEAGFELAPVGQVPPAGRENHPMVGITWDDAVTYCRWLSDKTGRIYRLPSEAEWEKAASWGTEIDKGTGRQGDKERKRRYPWGDAFDATKCNTAESGIGATTAVGVYSAKGGDSPYGCADMAGNVWEWTSTCWGAERSQPQYAPPYDPGDGRENQDQDEPFREYRIVRGGSYQDAADRVTCTTRRCEAADNRSPRRGFRVVMDVSDGGRKLP